MATIEREPFMYVEINGEMVTMTKEEWEQYKEEEECFYLNLVEEVEELIQEFDFGEIHYLPRLGMYHAYCHITGSDAIFNTKLGAKDWLYSHYKRWG